MSPCLFEIPVEGRLEAGTLKWTSDEIFHFGEANHSSKKGLEIGAGEDFVTGIRGGNWVTTKLQPLSMSIAVVFLTFRIWDRHESLPHIVIFLRLNLDQSEGFLGRQQPIKRHCLRNTLLTSWWWSGGAPLKISGLKDHLSQSEACIGPY